MTRKFTDIKTNKELDFNDAFATAFDVMENTGRNAFVTGKAGTGKSTLLEYFRDHTSKSMAILAPTGVAAVNVHGQTIHSFFRFRPDITPETVSTIRLRKEQRKIFKTLETIVIDEISMVRADLLDCINEFLKIYGPQTGLPFGGVQMVFFGDLYQLPPVVTRHEQHIFRDVYASPYFFDAKSFRLLNMQMIELEEIYRQKEEGFIKLLGAIREKKATNEDIEHLNSRHQPDFQPDEKNFYIYLTTTNAVANRVNEERLKALRTKSYKFDGDLFGEFDQKSLPTHLALDLKFGAQVMLLNNDPEGRWINGSIGRVVEVAKHASTITVELSGGKIVDVEPFTWEMYRFTYNEELEQVESESVGEFTQFPLKLAWAVTIHKSQGKTFERAVIDIGSGTFAHGQTYVALSRCTSFEGLILRRPIYRQHILLDQRVINFMNAYKQSMLVKSKKKKKKEPVCDPK